MTVQTKHGHFIRSFPRVLLYLVGDFLPAISLDIFDGLV